MTENQLRYLQYQENQRHNLAAEEISRDQNTETARHNLASEDDVDQARSETVRANRAKEHETIRSNVTREDETQRHNVMSEILNAFGIAQNAYSTTANLGAKLLG